MQATLWQFSFFQCYHLNPCTFVTSKAVSVRLTLQYLPHWPLSVQTVQWSYSPIIQFLFPATSYPTFIKVSSLHAETVTQGRIPCMNLVPYFYHYLPQERQTWQMFWCRGFACGQQQPCSYSMTFRSSV